MEEKFVKLSDVEIILKLYKLRDAYYDWSEEYEKYDKEIKKEIEKLMESAVTINRY